MIAPQPEFFDIFGIGVFIFIIGASFWMLWTNQPLPRWARYVLLLIGITGLLVDGIIVYLHYLFVS